MRPPEASFIDDIKIVSGKHSRNHTSERSLIYAWELPCLSSRIFVFEPDGSCKIVDVTCGAANLQESIGFSKMVASPQGDIAALATGENSVCDFLSVMLLTNCVVGVVEYADTEAGGSGHSSVGYG